MELYFQGTSEKVARDESSSSSGVFKVLKRAALSDAPKAAVEKEKGPSGVKKNEKEGGLDEFKARASGTDGV